TRDDLGEGVYDLVLASNVLHIYDEKTNRLVLEKVFRALRPGGRVVVHDYFLQNSGPAPEAALFDLNMLLGTLCGRVYGAGEVKCWLEGAGFQKISFLPLDRGSGLLTGRKNAFPVQKGAGNY
ncbi:MAG: methyltransferase, partial [Desulfotomaculales bacterium]